MSRGGFDDNIDRMITGIMPIPAGEVLSTAKEEYARDPNFLNDLWTKFVEAQGGLATLVGEHVRTIEQPSMTRDLFTGAAALAFDLLRRQGKDTLIPKGGLHSRQSIEPFEYVEGYQAREFLSLFSGVREMVKRTRENLRQDGNGELVADVKEIMGMGRKSSSEEVEQSKKVEQMVLLVYAVLRWQMEKKQQNRNKA